MLKLIGFTSLFFNLIIFPPNSLKYVGLWFASNSNLLGSQVQLNVLNLLTALNILHFFNNRY
jgi:hypothetical protein